MPFNISLKMKDSSLNSCSRGQLICKMDLEEHLDSCTQSSYTFAWNKLQHFGMQCSGISWSRPWAGEAGEDILMDCHSCSVCAKRYV